MLRIGCPHRRRLYSCRHLRGNALPSSQWNCHPFPATASTQSAASAAEKKYPIWSDLCSDQIIHRPAGRAGQSSAWSVSSVALTAEQTFLLTSETYPRLREPRDNVRNSTGGSGMVSLNVVFFASVLLTASSGLAATCIVLFGDTRHNTGQRAVAEKFAQIALIGAAAVASLLAVA